LHGAADFLITRGLTAEAAENDENVSAASIQKKICGISCELVVILTVLDDWLARNLPAGLVMDPAPTAAMAIHVDDTRPLPANQPIPLRVSLSRGLSLSLSLSLSI
jgi:hypothetical protein